jgi:hypothetical protein
MDYNNKKLSYSNENIVNKLIDIATDKSIEDYHTLNSVYQFQSLKFIRLKKSLIECSYYSQCKKHKLCRECNKRLQNKRVKEFDILLTKNPNFLKKKWYYIVITLKHKKHEKSSKQYTTANDLLKLISKEIRTKKKGFWSDFDGYISTIETTKNNNGWNVHINILLNTAKTIHTKKIINKNTKANYINKELKSFLLSKTKDSYIHNIQKVKGNSKTIKKELISILKYTLKFPNLETKDLIYFNAYLHRKRLFSISGNLKKP